MGTGKHFGSSSGKANKPKVERNFREIWWYQCQCSGSSQIPSQDDLNYHQFLSLYKTNWRNGRTELTIYDTENEKEEVKILDTKLRLDSLTVITQLPNGELFCNGSYNDSGITLIIDRSYGFKMLPSGIRCRQSSALYFDNNIYCFGGYDEDYRTLSRKFDLKNNRWINLNRLPVGLLCHSVIFNKNILISGNFSENLGLYSIETDSFSIIPYTFAERKRKFMINVEKLYLIEWDDNGLIYESEDEYDWKPISKSKKIYCPGQMYCLYNKEKIYISRADNLYHFDLKEKIVSKIK